jgi:hypothetical protein
MLKTTPSRSLKVKNLQKTLECIIYKSDDVGKKEDLEDISNEDKESCDDVDKREYLEHISNEGKESTQTLDCNNSKCDDVEFFSSE